MASVEMLEMVVRVAKNTLIMTITLRLQKGLGAFWARVSALGTKVWDVTTRVQEH